MKRRELLASPQPYDLITLEPGKRGGKPCIRGLRITVADRGPGVPEPELEAIFGRDWRAMVAMASP